MQRHNRFSTILFPLLLLFSVTVFSAELELTSEQIIQYLSGQKIEGNQNGMLWEQSFKTNGETHYFEKKANRPPSPGLWKAINNMYCSQWPPSNRWDCYRFTADGNSLTFIPANGGASWPAIRLPKE